MPTFGGPKQPSGDWELFLGMWERANSVRTFFWSQRIDDPKLLLTHFLPRLRRYFAVDFCFGVLNVSEETIVEVGVPESAVHQLPPDFSRRCLESVANSRSPVTWKDAGAGLGFRSTVVAPLRAPNGPSFGFLLLGHTRSRSYTPIELFLLQALAGELSWVVRDLAARNVHQQRYSEASRTIRNGLRAISGNTARIRQKNSDSADGIRNQYLDGIDRAVEQVLQSLSVLPEPPPDEESPASPDAESISHVVNRSLASCQQAAKERGIDVEVVCTPGSPSRNLVLPDRVKGILNDLVDRAALATHNETVRVTVRPGVTDVELMVQGTGSNRVADRLKELFEDTTRSAGTRDEQSGDLVRVREYLEDTGGDVYVKSRPGEAAEFVVRLPLEGAAQAGRL